MKKLGAVLIIILFTFAIFAGAIQAQDSSPEVYSSELIFAEPPARYFILPSKDIVFIDSLGKQNVVGKKLDKKFWSEGGFIIELHDTEYAIDGNDFIWSREGQFLTTVGNHVSRQ